ncbi:hypothetical protein GC722_14900 [Auraticoccus sp. F435]|uniref:Cell division protein FtsL n=1 Tax=Auraticoccus cholistanensis TaxID=2656650 RepID=A0A6A9UX62_9ACTN|nr:hypothetical protein [Auraticoccus cholistanensis]MVA77301.1 hypothetical protein [Auraticoccus cholistanensis]
MSALLNVPGLRRPGPGPRSARHLRPVPSAVPRLARVPFLLVLAAVLGLGMVGLLVLNTTVQTNAVEVRALEQQLTTLSYTEAELKTRLDQAESPADLATKASDLGMRPNPYPAFIDLETGEVLGDPRPVEGKEMTSLVTKSDAQVAREQAAAEQRAAEERAAEQREREREAERRRAEQEQRAEQEKQDKKEQDEKEQDKKEQKEQEEQGD